MNKVILETCCEKRHHSLSLTMSQCLNVKRWTQTIWLGQSHVFISRSLQHASRMLRIKYEDHCSGSILLQMSQLWKHVACTTDCIMSYINSHRKYTGTLELVTEGSAPLLKANFHDSCWTLLDSPGHWENDSTCPTDIAWSPNESLQLHAGNVQVSNLPLEHYLPYTYLQALFPPLTYALSLYPIFPQYFPASWDILLMLQQNKKTISQTNS